jgi:hypothetical protein
MEINRINNNYVRSSALLKNKPAAEKTEAKVGDKIEISNEAKILQQQNTSTVDVAAIKEKIDNKFYESNEVYDKVADKILQEFEKTA